MKIVNNTEQNKMRLKDVEPGVIFTFLNSKTPAVKLDPRKNGYVDQLVEEQKYDYDDGDDGDDENLNFCYDFIDNSLEFYNNDDDIVIIYPNSYLTIQ